MQIDRFAVWKQVFQAAWRGFSSKIELIKTKMQRNYNLLKTEASLAQFEKSDKYIAWLWPNSTTKGRLNSIDVETTWYNGSAHLAQNVSRKKSTRPESALMLGHGWLTILA